MDARSLVKEINRSKRRTMTKRTMTNNAMTYIAEAFAVVLIFLLGVAILSL
jgi:hypothetical protein